MIIDTHTHLYDEDFREDFDSVVTRAKEAGVYKCIMPGIDSSSYGDMCEVEKRLAGFAYSAIGLHPTSVKGDWEEELDFVKREFAGRRFCAVGEIGLDGYWSREFMTEQKRVFYEQIVMAASADCPIIVHLREATEDLYEVLEQLRSTYSLQPENHWYPDLEELENKVKYNPSIAGILILNPDNPTGMVYPLDILKKIVDIAKRYNLFIICDEIYNKITYNGAHAYALAEYIGDVPGIALKGISKEYPWPGARCGWAEYYNRDKDEQFDAFCRAIDNAKMVEVCSTTLPQMTIPRVLGDKRFKEHRDALNEKIGRRSAIINEILSVLKTFYKRIFAGRSFWES